MISIRPGSHTHKLISLLAIVGEFPMRSVGILGSVRSWKALISNLAKPQIFSFPDSDDGMQCRLLTITGKGKLKSIRLYRGAMPVLERVSPELYWYYAEHFLKNNFSGDEEHVERNHRVAEAVAMCLVSGIEILPHRLPVLRADQFQKLSFEKACFYVGKDLKKLDIEMKKTMYARMVGALFCPSDVYPVYNSRNALMKWNGKGEFKALISIQDICNVNTAYPQIRSAVLMGMDYPIALRTLEEAKRTAKLDLRFDGIYRHIHFVPMTPLGKRLLQLMTLPNWKEKLLELLFDPEDRAYDRGHFEYDALVDGKYVYSFLDSDISRLSRFRIGMRDERDSCQVLCYPEQVSLLRSYLGDKVELRTIRIEQVEEAILP